MGYLTYIAYNILKDINNSRKKSNSVYIYITYTVIGKTKSHMLCCVYCKIPYLNTTTSEQVENTKAFELTIIKELGKLTP